MSKFTESVVYNGEEIEVSGCYYKACRGMRERGTGLQLEPDEPASIEIESIMYKGIDVVNLLESAFIDIEGLVWDAFMSREPDYPDEDDR
jgi:hypothetical protein